MESEGDALYGLENEYRFNQLTVGIKRHLAV